MFIDLLIKKLIQKYKQYIYYFLQNLLNYWGNTYIGIIFALNIRRIVDLCQLLLSLLLKLEQPQSHYIWDKAGMGQIVNILFPYYLSFKLLVYSHISHFLFFCSIFLLIALCHSLNVCILQPYLFISFLICLGFAA